MQAWKRLPVMTVTSGQFLCASIPLCTSELLTDNIPPYQYLSWEHMQYQRCEEPNLLIKGKNIYCVWNFRVQIYVVEEAM